jgi:hypothetical protein
MKAKSKEISEFDVGLVCLLNVEYSLPQPDIGSSSKRSTQSGVSDETLKGHDCRKLR